MSERETQLGYLLRSVAWTCGFAAIVATSATFAEAASPAVCASAKLVATGREAARLLGCHAAAARAGTEASAACLTRASERRSTVFARVDERGGCETSGDSDSIGVEVGVAIGLVRDQIRPSPAASRCAQQKLFAAAIRLRSDLLAVARDARRPDPEALSRALATNLVRFDARFAAAEVFGDCLVAGDRSVVDASLAATATRLRALLLPVCGDAVRVGVEQCDATDDQACPSGCLADCTCTPVCGNGIVEEPAEECDGAVCSPAGPAGERECAPPSDPVECQCCSSGSTPCMHHPSGWTSPCCGGQVCLLEFPPSPASTLGYCAEPCGSHDDCPAGEFCTAGGGCRFFPPCTEDADCPMIPPFDVHCTPVGACEACLEGLGCSGPMP